MAGVTTSFSFTSAGGCTYTKQSALQLTFTSDVINYDGAPLVVSLPPSPGLNDVLEALDGAIAALSPTTSLTTLQVFLANFITVYEPLTGTYITLAAGTDLQTVLAMFNAIQVSIGAVILPQCIRNSAFSSADTILKADTANTPTALSVTTNSFIGRIGGHIQNITFAQAITGLNMWQRDATNLNLYPINTTDHVAIGNGAATDKTILVIKDNATYANNPLLGYFHAPSGFNGLLYRGYYEKTQIAVWSPNESARFQVVSSAVAPTHNQDIYLSSCVGLTGGTIQSWIIRKDGSDSQALKVIWDTGGAEQTKIKLTTTGLLSINSTTAINAILDEDNMASDSALAVPTQQSVKAYVDVTQAELDVAEVGAGLNTNGTYTAPVGTTFLGGATSLKNADFILDYVATVTAKAIMGDILMVISPLTVNTPATAFGWTRNVTITLKTASGQTYIGANGSYATTLAIGDTSVAGTATIVSTTLTFVNGVATVVVSGDAMAWLAAETDTLTVSNITIMGYTITGGTSKETFV